MIGTGRVQQNSAGHRSLPLWGPGYPGPGAQPELALIPRSISSSSQEEAESSGLSSARQHFSQRARGREGGREGGREEESPAEEEGPGGGSLIQTRHC